MMNRIMMTSLVAATLFSTACGGRQSSDELDVTRVVIYQSGIAYMERSGEFRGDEMTMSIRAEQINDVLTSMVVVDRGSQDAVSVSLPVDRSNATNLYNLPVDLQQAGGFYSVFNALRGAEVTIFVDRNRRVRGRVVGVEVVDNDRRVTLLDDHQTLTAISMDDIERFEVENESIAMALEHALDQRQSEGDWRPIDVTIRFSHDGNHDVAMAYVVAMPIWKPAYRVIVNDNGTLLLQGWAVVDNTSGEDWNNVQLSLTAGTPISFEYDIHAPIYIDRPDLTGYGIPDVASLAPPNPMQARPSSRSSGFQQSTSGGMRGNVSHASPSPPRSRSHSSSRSSSESFFYDESEEEMMFEMAPPSEGVFDDGASSFSSQSAEVENVGALFRFDIPGRVTIPDQSSTLVTLINSEIEGEDALVYQPGSGAGNNAYRALLLQNSTGYPIQPAPLAIYAHATFVGEGITPIINPNEDAFVPYALDSRVSIDQRTSSSTGQVTLARIINSQIYVEQENIQGVTYNVVNSLSEDMRLYVQLNRWGGYELVDLDEDDLRVHSGYYLVPMELTAGEPATMTVEQVSRSLTQIALFSPHFVNVLGVYLSSPEARPDLVETLAPIQTGITRYNDIETELYEQRRLRSDIQLRVGELRASITTLGDADRNRDLRDTLVERLGEQEAMLDQITSQLVLLSEEQAVIRIEITESLRTVTLDREEE